MSRVEIGIAEGVRSLHAAAGEAPASTVGGRGAGGATKLTEEDLLLDSPAAALPATSTPSRQDEPPAAAGGAPEGGWGGVHSPQATSMRESGASESSPEHLLEAFSPQTGSGVKLYGLGVTFKRSDGKGGMVIKRIKEYGCAAQSGMLLEGDRVLEINGTPLDDITDAMQLAALTHGVAGSVAGLKVLRRDGETLTVNVERNELTIIES